MIGKKKPHCSQLFDDILECGRNHEPSNKHFTGSVVYVDSDKFQPPQNKPRLIIDGQQRLTTIMLLLHAVAKKIAERRDKGLEVPESIAELQIYNDYLVNPSLSPDTDSYFKLILAQRDKETFKAILADREMPTKFSKKIKENYEFLASLVSKHADELDILLNGLYKIQIVVVMLEKNIDNPQLVFESMNSTGKPLAESDKIRNFILMGLDPDLQKRLYTDHWQPMEELFRPPHKKEFDSFMRHYLTLDAGNFVTMNNMYSQFKKYASDKENEDVVKRVKKFAEHYSKFALDRETDRELKAHFSTLKKLDSRAHPFLLVLYDDYHNGILEKKDFLAVLNFCESYLFRLLMAKAAKGSRNKAFMRHLARETQSYDKDDKKEKYLANVKKIFRSLSGEQLFPRDEQFIENIKENNMYDDDLVKNYWLEKMENFDRKEKLHASDYTVEHVMPQTLTEDWKKELGDDYERDHRELLHNLGNLTWTAYNSEYSNYPYERKRNMEKPKGLKYSELYLNEDFRHAETWNREAIIARAERLSQRAVEVWPFPDVDE